MYGKCLQNREGRHSPAHGLCLEKACWKLRCWKFWKMERDWFVFIIREFYALLEQIGQMPLPPYITEKLENQEIPDGIFQRIGVCCSAYGRLAFYTGTHEEAGRKGRSFWIRDFACRVRYFSSCQCRKGREEHIMHSEHYEMPKETADLILETKSKGWTGDCRWNNQLPYLRICCKKKKVVSKKVKVGQIFSFIRAINFRYWTV